MQSMIIFVSCALAAASAGYTPYGPSSYAFQNNGAYNSPANHGGLPVQVQDTHEVAAAKAAHFQAVAAAKAAPGYNAGYNANQGYAPINQGYAHAAPISHGAPVPVQDTYEVAAAKAAHFQAVAAVKAAPGYNAGYNANQGYAPINQGYAHAAPVAHGAFYGAGASAGAPQDTYEVAAAKAAHFQAHAAVRGQAHAGSVAHGYGYAQAAPVAHGGYYGAAAGAPLPVQDTYEVAAAKAAHFLAHAAVKNGHLNQY